MEAVKLISGLITVFYVRKIVFENDEVRRAGYGLIVLLGLFLMYSVKQ